MNSTHELFTAALVLVVRDLKGSRCPSTDEWFHRQYCTQTAECYLSIKRHSFESTTAWLDSPDNYITEKKKTKIIKQCIRDDSIDIIFLTSQNSRQEE